MTSSARQKKPFQLFSLSWPNFLIIAVIVFGAAYLGVLPTGMVGCFAFMIVLGTLFNWIGDHTPIIKSYLGGGAIVCIFGAGLRVLLLARKNIAGKNSVRIVNASPLVKKVFEVTGLVDLFAFE